MLKQVKYQYFVGSSEMISWEGFYQQDCTSPYHHNICLKQIHRYGENHGIQCISADCTSGLGGHVQLVYFLCVSIVSKCYTEIVDMFAFAEYLYMTKACNISESIAVFSKHELFIYLF